MGPTRVVIVQAYDAKQARKLASKNALSRYKDDYLSPEKTTCIRHRKVPGLVYRG
jgi:hypothetical protein